MIDADKLARGLSLVIFRLNELEAKTGVGGWYAETIQETCNWIARDAGLTIDYDSKDSRYRAT